MNTIQFYMDEARRKGNISSDRRLATMCGLKPNAATFWRVGKSFPTDDVMIRLAEIARIAPETALLELAMWRSDGKAQKTYASILQKITQTALCTALFMASLLTYTPAAANDDCRANCVSVYIMENE